MRKIDVPIFDLDGVLAIKGRHMKTFKPRLRSWRKKRSVYDANQRKKTGTGSGWYLEAKAELTFDFETRSGCAKATDANASEGQRVQARLRQQLCAEKR